LINIVDFSMGAAKAERSEGWATKLWSVEMHEAVSVLLALRAWTW
jgi:hypothetical protein